MANPIFNALGGNMPFDKDNFFVQVQQFRQKMQGINPNEEISRLLQSGAISQQELNYVQQIKQKMQSMFRQ